MKLSATFERAQEAKSRAEVLGSLLPARAPLTLPEVQRLTRHLSTLDDSRLPLRVAVLRTYTSDLLDPYLTFEALLQGFACEIYHAPYGAIVQEAVAGSGLVGHRPDVTLVLLRWEDIAPELAGPLSGLTTAEREARTEAARGRVQEQIRTVREAVGGHLLVTLLPSLQGPELGDHDINGRGSARAWRGRATHALAADLHALPSTTVLDLEESLATLGRERFFDLRLWYTARFPFSSAAAQDLARRVIAVAVVLKLARAKVIALDADNTLWGGIIGEDGLHGIALGPEYPGNVYVAFQRRLLDYQQRGFILALCSKNNEADVLEVLREHPHQLLREEHFAALRVNWDPKPQNLQSLAEELNLGLDSFVFVDDSAHECHVVRHALPAVDVIQVPARPVDIPSCLDRLPRLEILALTDEDQRKTTMYVQERKRRDFAAARTDTASYLSSLNMEMAVSLDERPHVARVAQLTQKTNQFNLSTRRYSEDDIVRLMESDDWLVAEFSLRDVFGDSGIVGVGLVRLRSPHEAELDTFLMSCRVIGRTAETVFLETVLDILRTRGVRTVVADYVPTSKNGLVATFLPDHGFLVRPDGRYERALGVSVRASDEAGPIVVRVAGHRPAVTA